ncbi:hypothetical protein BU14_0121s0005 [Porphyra umbilicalis]|uniref:F-box domain-containing protein n=1 Tax=Porphyra umbilicalis TaxID=2786 RepID=A0A1X6PBG7_PORUM|nr:hypothetical protein BU14_0121s0005 [Porphyra umbilicalis]|eukprot:OSX78076.1 hypothetical protein BU14_0121s0005 [Porphyra umbilicalis]
MDVSSRPRLPPCGLADLPDELLGVVASHFHPGARGRPGRAHVGFLGACRRMSHAGYAGFASVTLRSRPAIDGAAAVRGAAAPLRFEDLSDPVLLLLSPEGAALQARLRSTLGFLGHTPRLTAVELHPDWAQHGNELPTAAYEAFDALFFSLLLRELRRLCLTSLTASLTAVAALRGPRVSAGPLRVLRLYQLDEDDATIAAVTSVMHHHGGELTELILSDIDLAPIETSHAIAPWFYAPPGGCPRLATLVLEIAVDAAGAAAVAAACPAVTDLTLWCYQGHPGVGAALRAPAALPALADLRWHFSYLALADFGVEATHLLAGRALSTLVVQTPSPAQFAAPMVITPALAAAAAPPAALDVGAAAAWGDGDLAAAAAAAAAAGGAGPVRLTVTLAPSVSAAGVDALGRLTGLRHLDVRLDAAADAVALRLADWPVGGLLSLTVRVGWGASAARHDHRRPSRGVAPAVLAGVAASGSARTLVSLALAGPPLDEETAAPQLAALPALREWEYTVTGEGWGGAAATVGMAVWLRRRFPALRLRFVQADASDAEPRAP